MLQRSVGAVAVSVCVLTIAQSLTERAQAVDLCLCAPPTITGHEDHAYDTQFFAGLQWNFGDMTPALDLGVRRVRTDQSDDTFGAKADLDFKLTPTFWESPTFRLLGEAGKRDAQGEFGLGLSGLDFKPLIAGGVQGPYIDAGANYVFGKGLDPYVGVTSLAPPRSPHNGKLTCPTGYHLEPASVPFIPPPAADVLKGQTCHL